MEGSYPESKIPSCYLGRFFYFPKNLAVKAIVNVQQRERERVHSDIKIVLTVIN